MPEGTEAPPETGDATTTESTPESTPTPPWEQNGEPFDPERAWGLIQNLRTERETLRQEREQLTGRVSEFEQANQTETERLQSRAETAERDRDELRRELIALQHGLPADLLDRLRGDTPEELAEDAKRLKALLAPEQPQPQPWPHGPRQVASGGDMNSLILGALKRQ